MDYTWQIAQAQGSLVYCLSGLGEVGFYLLWNYCEADFQDIKCM